MSGERDLKKVEGLGKVVIKAMTSFMSYKPIKPDIILKDGDEIGGMKVYHVPGHTPGSICLYKKDEAVFTGDTIITALTGKPRGPVKIFTLDMDKAWKSVEMISKLDFNLLLPGHGKPVKKDASSKVKQLQR